MNLISELENEFYNKMKKGTIEEQEKIAIDFLCSLNFYDKDIQKQALSYVSHMLSDYVEKNEAITSLETKMMYCMLAKTSLAKLGLDNVKINFRNRTESDRNAGAFYLPSDNSLTFFNDVVCDKRELMDPYPGVKGGESRLDFFARQIMILEHEIQHAKQFSEIEDQKTNLETMSTRSYITEMQQVARLFATARNSKYFKKDNIDALYRDNHDQFYYEIDADKHGIERMLTLSKVLSPKMYELAIDEKRNSYTRELNKKNNELANYDNINWKHDTNPNKGEVSATHKSSMIIDSVLPKLSRSQRNDFFVKYPALRVNYNIDGSKKTLEQVEKEKQSKILDVLVNGSDSNVQNEANSIANLYDTAIEGDAVLSLERCLQHIARLSWGSDRYFTDAGIEVKYSPKHIRKELENAQNKAKQIASTIEDVDAKTVNNLFAKYEKEVMNSKKTNDGSLRFYEDKKLAIYNIQYTFNHNEEYKTTIKEQEEQKRKENLEKQEIQKSAIQLLKKVFPNFTPSQYAINDGKLTVNAQEKMVLMEACSKYLKSIPKENKDKDFISVYEVKTAINNLYDVQITQEDKEDFIKMLAENKIDIPENKYQLEENVEQVINNEATTNNEKIENGISR